MQNKLPTGTEVMDKLLEQGYDRDTITTIYGPAATGKTTMCLLASISMVKEGKKIIFIDTEGGFSVERLQQLTEEHENVLKNILFLKPTNFKEQMVIFGKLKDLIDDKIGLIIVDTISMLYRIEMGKNKEEIQEVNRLLGQQISYLSEIARKKNVPVILTNQVYADFENKENVKMVGGDLLKYGSKCLIELKKYKTKRKAILRKHRSLPENKEVVFEITQTGLQPAEQ